MSTFKQFLDIPELVGLVLAFLPWLDLMHLAHMNAKLRACAQDTVRVHIMHMLAPFINKDDQPAFWAALNACSGAIIGELPLLLMLHSPSIPPTALPLCEMMVPSGRKQALAIFLRALGFVEEEEPPEKIRSHMVRHEDRPLYLIRSIEAQSVWISIIESPWTDLWKGMLGGGTTAEMNVLTAGRLICLYPMFTLKRRFKNNGWLQSQTNGLKSDTILQYHSLIPIPSYQWNGERCSKFCDYNWRTSFEMEQIGQFNWNPDIDGGLGSIPYKWRLNEVCRNVYCPEYLLPQPPYAEPLQSEFNTIIAEHSTKSNFYLCHWWKALQEGTTSPIEDDSEVVSSLSVLAIHFRLGTGDDLRKALRISGAVISGSAALSRISGDGFAPGDLDIYVSKYADFQSLRLFLAKNHYVSVIVPSLIPAIAYSGGLISAMETFHHHHSGRIVQVIYSTNYSAWAPILDFDSTLLMNFISADNIVCLYPDLTINRVGKRLTRKFRALDFFAKYSRRGFKMMAQVPEESNDRMYKLTKITDPSVIAVPFTLGPFEGVFDAAWVLPFQGVNPQTCRPGFWFDDVDEYVWIDVLTGGPGW